jgi:hypothetical protein
VQRSCRAKVFPRSASFQHFKAVSKKPTSGIPDTLAEAIATAVKKYRDGVTRFVVMVSDFNLGPNSAHQKTVTLRIRF